MLFPLIYCRNIQISASRVSLAVPLSADSGTQKRLHYAELRPAVQEPLEEPTRGVQIPAGRWCPRAPAPSGEPCPAFLPSLQSAGGRPRRGGRGSWRCVRGPGRCRAAAGRSGPTGSADRLQGGRRRQEGTRRVAALEGRPSSAVSEKT